MPESIDTVYSSWLSAAAALLGLAGFLITVAYSEPSRGPC